MKNNANNLKKNNRSDPENYTKTVLFLFYLLTAHWHWPNALRIWSNAQIDQMRLTS